MLESPEFWVAVAFVGFLAVVLYFKLPAMINERLDERASRIRGELEEAQRLREEAQALYAQYKRKAEDAAEEAKSIADQAKSEAERFANEARAALAASLERRKALAEAKIEQAEAQAVQAIRDATVEASVAAAREVLSAEIKGEKADNLIDHSISELKKHLH